MFRYNAPFITFEQAFELANRICRHDHWVGEEDGVPYIIVIDEDEPNFRAEGFVGVEASIELASLPEEG